MKFKGHTLFVTAILLVFVLLTGCASNTPTASDLKKVIISQSISVFNKV